MLLALWAATALAWALLMRWTLNIWPWRFLYAWLPGAAAARVVSRSQLVLTLPAVVLAIAVLAAWWRAVGRLRYLVAIAAVLLLVEQINGLPLHNLDRDEERAFRARIGTPPPGCTVFYATHGRPGPSGDMLLNGIYSHNVDAMILAALSSVPTINGLSTFAPPGYDLYHPDRPDYAARVQAMLDRQRLREGVCVVDFGTGTWRLHAAPAP